MTLSITAKEILINRVSALTPEELEVIVASMLNGAPLLEGTSSLNYYINAINALTDEEAQATLNEIEMMETKEVPLPEAPEEPIEKVIAPWALNAIKHLVCLDKSMLISFFRVELKRAVNKDDIQQIEAVIAKLSVDDVYWNARIKPFVLKTRNWTDDTPGSTTEMLAKMGLSTQKGVSAATNWSGDQFVKLGNLLKRNSEQTGKVVALPLYGLARLLAKKPTTPVKEKELVIQPLHIV